MHTFKYDDYTFLIKDGAVFLSKICGAFKVVGAEIYQLDDAYNDPVFKVFGDQLYKRHITTTPCYLIRESQSEEVSSCLWEPYDPYGIKIIDGKVWKLVGHHSPNRLFIYKDTLWSYLMKSENEQEFTSKLSPGIQLHGFKAS